MDSLLHYDSYDLYLRTGKTVNMCEELCNLEMKYGADLKASMDTFETYDEVSNETLNDLNNVKTALNMYCAFGYIDAEELNYMEKYAEVLRLKMLEALNG